MPELRSLTGLRWVAAFWVFLFHAHIHYGWLKETRVGVERLLMGGSLGVTLFFVLSGFIMAHVYLPGGRMAVAPPAYWRARFARIWPLTTLAILLATPFWWAEADLALLQALTGLVSALTFTQAWFQPTVFAAHGGTWSLSVEAFFYLLFPLLGPMIARLDGRALRWVIGGAWAASAWGSVLVTVYGTDNWSALYASPLMRLPEFVSGVALGVLFARRTPGREDGRVALLAALALVAGIIVSEPPLAAAPALNWFAVPLIGLVIAFLARAPGRLAAPLAHPVMRSLGQVSFAFYLMQAPAFSVGRLLRDLYGWSPSVLTLVVLALNLALAYAGHHLLERPAQRSLRAARPAPSVIQAA